MKLLMRWIWEEMGFAQKWIEAWKYYVDNKSEI